MKKSLFILLCAAMLTVVCCTERPPVLTEEEQAQAFAVECYEALYDGDLETFLDGRANAADMPESFRKTMLLNLKQHVASVKAVHRGVKGVKSSYALLDTTHIMQVYLLLQYGDSTEEEILVPMMQVDDEWKLK